MHALRINLYLDYILKKKETPLMKISKLSIIEFTLDESLKEWINGSDKWVKRLKTKSSQLHEHEWSQNYLSSTTHQWSNSFGEKLVRFLLERQGEKCTQPGNKYKCRLDIETDNYIVEVKTRNWSTSGTAGEKIYFTPIKYWELPRLYKKILIVVLVGYQEYEARHKFRLWNNDHGGNVYFRKLCIESNTFYIGASELIDNTLNDIIETRRLQ